MGVSEPSLHRESTDSLILNNHRAWYVWSVLLSIFISKLEFGFVLHIQYPIQIGAMGKEALSFLKELGHRILTSTCEPQAYQLLLQQVTVTVQRGNAATVLDTCTAGDGVFSSILTCTYCVTFHLLYSV